MSEARKHLRFRKAERLEHWVSFLAFTILAITGLVQKFATVAFSQSIISLLGGIESVRIIHRIAAIVLMVEVVYHLGMVVYKVVVRRTSMSMLPGIVDARNALQLILHNLNPRNPRPQQGRYTFEEKLEYWAFIWGTIIMGVTGFALWNPIATAKILPGEVIPAAKAAHGGEALLAVLAVIIWHFYHVHLRQFNRSMFTGYLTEEEMLEEHPLELADAKLEAIRGVIDPETLQKRRRSFFLIYPVVALLLLTGIYFFVTLEETAIKTVPPPEDVVVFSPLTPTPIPTAHPTQTPSEDRPTTWDQGFGELFSQRCAQCHGVNAPMAELDLSSYEGALQGGSSGAAISPGDSAASILVLRQAEGNHPGQFTGDELFLIRQWIDSGAPQE
jgi:formate dehydrogenase gamma subunit